MNEYVTLNQKQTEQIINRLAELEDMKREAELITFSSDIYLERQKLALIAEGKDFSYQQGALDAWEQMIKVLDGKTNFHQFVGEVKTKIKAEQEQNPMEIG